MALTAFKSRQESQNDIAIPTLADISQPYKELCERITALELESAALRQEQIALIPQAQSERASSYQPPEESEEQKKRRVRLSRLVGEALPDNGPSPGSARDRMAAIDSRMKDITDAVSILKVRRGKERIEASKIVCDQVAESYRALVSELCQALIRVHEVNRRYSQFADTMNGNDIAWCSMRPMPPQFIGDPSNKHSDLAQYLFEARDHNFMKSSDMPAEFR
jgi:hypothetical protein